MIEESKMRGRPPLSPEEKERRRVEKNTTTAVYHKKTGYAAQKKYQQTHKEQYQVYKKKQRGSIYEPKIRIPMEYKNELSQLLKEEEMSLTQLFIFLVREKYGIDFSKSKNSLK